MRFPKGRESINPGQMQLENRSTVLRLLRLNENACRKDLAEMSGLTGATVTNLIRDLVDVGLISEDKNYSGPRSRNAMALRFNYDDFLIVGATFRRGVLRCAVADFGGRFLEKREIPLALDQPVEDVLRTLRAAVSDLINRFSSRGTIVGLGVSVPGPIDLEKGEIPRLTNLPGWNAIPIKCILEDTFDLPIVIDDNANAAAIAEKWFGFGRAHDNLISVLVSNGVGAGVVIDGQVFHGAYGFAGELGHVSIDFNGPQCECGNHGCVELYCSALSLLRRGKSLEGSQFTSFDQMVDAAKLGDERVLGMVADSGRYLGYSLVNLVNLFNPELLVVHGDMLRFGRVWSDSVARALTERMLPEVAERLEIHPTGLSDDPVLTGAIAMVFDYIVNSPRLEYFVARSSLARA